MSLYTKDSIDKVKDTVDMVELVGARTDLRRVGTRFTGICPFHEERTPSFSVNAEHKLYHCFGCGASGDSIRFVQEVEGLDFKQAVEALAERYNVELKREQEDPAAERRRERRERLLKLVQRATDYYTRYLWDSKEAAVARDYMAGRGLEEQVLRDFRVGYAPSAWDKVTVAAQRDGFTREEIAAAGLGQRGRGGSGFYDSFRARIMFPLADSRGRVVGFGARAVRAEQQPKYVNTREGELYEKRRQLFGIDLARGPAAKRGRILVVEGYTDVLALHQAGLSETVAIMGTSITPDQVTLLSQTTSSVFLALDADPSGQEAMLRASRVAADRKVELQVVEMPEGTDPAELVSGSGPEAFTELLGSASSVVEFQIRRVLADSDLQSPRGRDRAFDSVRPLIATADSPATRDHLVRYVADKLDLAPEVVNISLQTAPNRAPQDPERRNEPQRRPERLLDGASRSERAFLSMCLSQGDIGREYLARVTDGHLSSEALRLTRDHLVAQFADPLAQLPADDPAIAATITEVVMLADEEPSSEPALRLGFLQLELRRIERELRHAGQGDDFDRQRQLFSERESVREAIGNVMGETP
ncbi:MAG TPA: DNA primase [Thermoleophilaceae bacterium]|jgi:DNA primase